MIDFFSDFKGVTFSDIEVQKYNNRIIFTLDNGEKYMLYHNQDCCETVILEDICGDIHELIGSPILLAEETEDDGASTDDKKIKLTFYKLVNLIGSVTIRWYGSSNGYYSVSVNFKRIQ